jgi:hypothetical protein
MHAERAQLHDIIPKRRVRDKAARDTVAKDRMT